MAQALASIGGAAAPSAFVQRPSRPRLVFQPAERGPGPKPCLQTSSPGPRASRLVVKAAAAGALAKQASALIPLAGPGKKEAFVAGAEGPVGARIVQLLLQAGYKCRIGAVDADEAQQTLAFAKRFELLKANDKVEVVEINVADADELAASLPRQARLVVVVGDGKRGLEARAAQALLEAASERGAAQFVLVPLAGGGPEGFFGGLFGGAGSSIKGVEQSVVNSGLSFAIVRTGKVDSAANAAAEPAGALTAGPQGSLPPGARILKGQVAEVAVEVVKQAGDDVILEAWLDPAGEPSSVAQVVAQALPAAVVETEEPKEEEEPEPEEAAPPIAPLRAFGRAAKAAASEVEEDAEPSQGKSAPLFGIGRRAKSAVQSEDPAAAAEPAKKQGRRLFGRAKAAAEDAGETAARPAKALWGRAAKAAEDVDSAGPPKRKPLFAGFGKPKPEPEPEPQAQGLGGLFGTRRIKAGSSNGAAPPRGPGKQRQPAARLGRSKSNPSPAGEASSEKKGFLARLGLQQQTSYVDELD